jgi:hypothetical protein
MALLAEQLVEEWLNRQGYFTMRGIKVGVHEIDLLAIKPTATDLEARHIEVQISFRPISYISTLSTDQQKALGLKSKNSASTRPNNIIEEGVRVWVEKKFTSRRKTEMRDRVIPKANWKFELVHANVKEDQELKFIEAQGVKLIPFKTVIRDLCKPTEGWVGGSGTDIAEIINYYSKLITS